MSRRDKDEHLLIGPPSGPMKSGLQIEAKLHGNLLVYAGSSWS